VVAERLDHAEAELRRLIADRDEVEKAHGAAAEALGEHGRSTGLVTDPAGIREARDALARAELALERLLRAIHDVERAEAAVGAAREEAAQAGGARDAASVDHDRATAELDEADGRLRAARAADGATARELQQRAAALRTERETLGIARRQAELAQRSAFEALATAERSAEKAEDGLHDTEAARTRALDGVRVLGRHDLLSAALGREGAPGG